VVESSQQKMIFSDSGIKINEIYCCNALLSQQLLNAAYSYRPYVHSSRAGKFITQNDSPMYMMHSLSDINISQGSVATCLRRGAITDDFIAEKETISVKELFLIGQYLMNIWTRVWCLLVSDSRFSSEKYRTFLPKADCNRLDET